ncbi:MAG: hypothetical protein FWH26_04070 [Oscillospiraceae bacterium]|nr:hypothetical protein [Oscillospiraceae bacterium]
MHVKICSREELESLMRRGLHESTAVISFYEMGATPANIPGVHNEVFKVELDTSDLSHETYFPEAEILAHFVFIARNAGLKIICQCETGQTLSAGCAAAIRQYFNADGIAVFTDHHYSPDLLMYHRVYSALTLESVAHEEIPFI